jgi:hypothetical protein
MSTVDNIQPAATPDFSQVQLHQQAAEHIERVRRAVADVLTCIGASEQRPQAVARQLTLDKSLAWKLCRFVSESNPSIALSRMPGRPGMKIFCERLVSTGTPAYAVEAVSTASEAFETFTSRHAGTRSSLTVMLAAADSSSAADIECDNRKLSFQGNSAIWGVRARVQVFLQFIVPSAEKPGFGDLGVVCGLIDVHRLRSDVAWPICRLGFVDDNWKPFDPSNGASPGQPLPGSPQPMDPSVGFGVAPILPEYCSVPLPHLRTIHQPSGVARVELAEGAVGMTAAATCLVGWLHRGVAEFRSHPGNECGEYCANLNTPAEVLIHELFVHKSLTFATDPDLSLYSALPGGPAYPSEGRDVGQLRCTDRIIPVDPGQDSQLICAEVPFYASLVKTAIAQMGYPPTELIGFRRRMEYPPIPAISIFRHDLPA